MSGERPWSHQHDVPHDQTVIGRRGRQPIDSGRGFSHFSVRVACQQHLNQGVSRRDSPRELILVEQHIQSVTHQRYRAIAIPAPRPLTRGVHLDDRQMDRIEPLLQTHVAHLLEQLKSILTVCCRVAL